MSEGRRRKIQKRREKGLSYLAPFLSLAPPSFSQEFVFDPNLIVSIMGLISDLQEVFGTNDLYQVLGLKKDASSTDIKKGYRKLSLIHHPDRHCDDTSTKSKEEMTRAFQILSKVHFILSDEEKRKVYDSTGVVDDEDVLDKDADWDSYFRALFPRVKRKGM